MTVPSKRMRIAILGSLLGSLVLLTGMVLGLRLAGVLVAPMSRSWLVASGLLLAAVCASFRIVWLADKTQGRPPRLEHLARFGPLAGCGGFCLAILLPGTSLVAAGVFLVILAAEESYCCFLLPWRGPFDESIVQQVTRRRAADGREMLQGWLRLPLEPGQRTAVGHLAFCPPFGQTPRVTAQHAEGPDGRIRVEQTLPFGARVEVKLARATAEATDVVVRFSAETAV